MGNAPRKLSGVLPSKQRRLGLGPQPFTCEICMEWREPEQRFKNKHCSHPLCCDCISKYVDSKVQDNNADVMCPHVGCDKLLHPLWSLPFVPAQTFNRWCDVLCESSISGGPKAYCPNKACSELVLNECGGADVTRARCPRCKNLFCFKCSVPWHAGYRCENSGVKRDRNDVLFGLLVEKKMWQTCPRCNTYVELVSGCSMITCRCKQSFCYFCGAKSSVRHLFNCKGQWHHHL